jgi:hypothetical protein
VNASGLRIGRYEVLSEIGGGGIGVVYRALDPAIGRMVAVKTAAVSTGAPPKESVISEQRLVVEIRMAGAVSRPHIVNVYGAGQHAGSVYIINERVQSAALGSWLSGRVLDSISSCALLRQTASGLDHLHTVSIGHRDLKPANILIDSQRVVKVTDFEIAKAFSDPRLTTTGLLVGTPRYMSPEQFLGRPAGATSDQFALAIVVWQMLTGRGRFAGEDTATISHQVVPEDPAPPLRAALPRAGDVALRRALAKDAADRYSSCSEFVEAPESAFIRRGHLPRAFPIASAAAAAVCIAIIAPLLLMAHHQIALPSLPSEFAIPAKPSPQLAPPRADPGQRTAPSVARRMDGLRVFSRPTGASTVFDDGSTRCTTQCVLSLAAERHTLCVASAGHRLPRRVCALPEQSSLFIVLEQQSATLTIRSDPAGAAVSTTEWLDAITRPLCLLCRPAGTQSSCITRTVSAADSTGVSPRAICAFCRSTSAGLMTRGFKVTVLDPWVLMCANKCFAAWLLFGWGKALEPF